MQCSKCRSGAIVFQPYSGQHLCRDHFILDFEAKAKRTVRHQGGLRPGDSIAVALTGDSPASALLVFLKKITGNRRDIRLERFALTGSLLDLRTWATTSGYSRIAVAITLEEASASALSAILRGRLHGTGFKAGAGIPVIAPFSHIPAAEVTLYASLHGIPCRDVPALDEDPLQEDVRTLLGEYTRSHPQAPYAVLNICDALDSCDQRSRHKRT